MLSSWESSCYVFINVGKKGVKKQSLGKNGKGRATVLGLLFGMKEILKSNLSHACTITNEFTVCKVKVNFVSVELRKPSRGQSPAPFLPLPSSFINLSRFFWYLPNVS